MSKKKRNNQEVTQEGRVEMSENTDEITDFDELRNKNAKKQDIGGKEVSLSEKKEEKSESDKGNEEAYKEEKSEYLENNKEKLETKDKAAEDSGEKSKEKDKTSKEDEKKSEEEDKASKGSEDKFKEKDKNSKENEKKSEEEDKISKDSEEKPKEEDKISKGSEDKSKEKDKDSKDSEDKSKADDMPVEDSEPMKIDKADLKANSSNSKKIVAGVFGTVAALLLIAYIWGFVYFSAHFYPDAAINGVDVSNMNKTDAGTVLNRFYQDYKLTLITVDGSEVVIDGKDIAMEVSLHDEFEKCFNAQKTYLWFVNIMEHHDFEIGADASWNEALLDGEFDEMDILEKKEMVAPEDAYVGVENGRFTIVKEVMGNTLKEEEFKKAVESSLKLVQSKLDLVEAACYDFPKVYDTDEQLQKEYEAKNVYGENEIKLQMDDLTLEPGMELYDEVLEKSGDSYKISKSKVQKYVAALAKEYDTLGTERTFISSFNSRKVEVLGEAFGYELNQEKTTDALFKALNAGKAATVEAVFDNKGYTLQGDNDIGNTYVEVNLSEQHVIAYKNGKKIAEGDCVSGKEATGNGTCIGLYAIQGKQSPAVLRGEKVPKTKTVTKKGKKGKKVQVQETTMEYEYESPVTFWMPFNGGIGLHDAAGWRSQYGGSIYYYSGSHGCVNLPYDLAKEIYNNFDIGDPVVVYFWDNENRR
ncbi:MAG: L,D-transpeptidase/peptidoglycan binding protein [Lachnospiraceae bacterium]|nr:L,D-transpeptidase/peptidoglycan binding protein [Lachnospiraceae bacterium]